MRSSLLLHAFILCSLSYYRVSFRSSTSCLFADALSTRFILVETRHPGNVGAAARAIKTMGFDDLVLVRPKDPKVLNRERCKQGASGAVDILQKATVVDTLAEALENVDVWCATGMPHDMAHARPAFVTTTTQASWQNILEPACQSPREFLKKYAMFIQSQTEHAESPSNEHIIPSSIAFVFGNEKVGLQAEDLQQCHVVLSIPTNPSFGSLNLASAVQLLAYDWRQELGGFPLPATPRTTPEDESTTKVSANASNSAITN